MRWGLEGPPGLTMHDPPAGAAVPGSETWSRPSQALRTFVRGRTARTAGPTAALVGTILSAVNQGSTILDTDHRVSAVRQVRWHYGAGQERQSAVFAARFRAFVDV
jgi:hypothetical protein